jgi:hypothetical protein
MTGEIIFWQLLAMVIGYTIGLIIVLWPCRDIRISRKKSTRPPEEPELESWLPDHIIADMKRINDDFTEYWIRENNYLDDD